MAPDTAERTGSAPSLILVREWDQMISSSRCCGRADGDFLFGPGDPTFAERRRRMEGAGVLYRTVQEEFGDQVELRIVDPRNLLSLVPLLLRDFRRYRVSPGDALRTLSGFSVNSVILNGRIVSRGAWPDPEGLALRVAAAVRDAGEGRKEWRPGLPPGA